MFLVQKTVLLCLIFPIVALIPRPPPRTALAPRVRDQRRQGSSLSDVLDPALAKPLDDDTWDVYFDEETGYPYYHNVDTDQVQWEHPFADAPSPTVPECESPWLIYEFQFDGIFDHLTPIKYRSRIPRGDPSPSSLALLSEMARTDYDSAHERLEKVICKEELASRRIDAEESAHSVKGFSVPSADIPVEHRIFMAGAWNDLGNIWYARSDWETVFECFRRSLYWNPEQTAALINLASIATKLGFERDAMAVLNYYRSIEGGTMKGWTPGKEAAIEFRVKQGLVWASLPVVPALIGPEATLAYWVGDPSIAGSAAQLANLGLVAPRSNSPGLLTATPAAALAEDEVSRWREAAAEREEDGDLSDLLFGDLDEEEGVEAGEAEDADNIQQHVASEASGHGTQSLQAHQPLRDMFAADVLPAFAHLSVYRPLHLFPDGDKLCSGGQQAPQVCASEWAKAVQEQRNLMVQHLKGRSRERGEVQQLRDSMHGHIWSGGGGWTRGELILAGKLPADRWVAGSDVVSQGWDDEYAPDIPRNQFQDPRRRYRRKTEDPYKREYDTATEPLWTELFEDTSMLLTDPLARHLEGIGVAAPSYSIVATDSNPAWKSTASEPGSSSAWVQHSFNWSIPHIPRPQNASAVPSGNDTRHDERKALTPSDDRLTPKWVENVVFAAIDAYDDMPWTLEDLRTATVANEAASTANVAAPTASVVASASPTVSSSVGVDPLEHLPRRHAIVAGGSEAQTSSPSRMSPLRNTMGARGRRSRHRRQVEAASKSNPDAPTTTTTTATPSPKFITKAVDGITTKRTGVGKYNIDPNKLRQGIAPEAAVRDMLMDAMGGAQVPTPSTSPNSQSYWWLLSLSAAAVFMVAALLLRRAQQRIIGPSRSDNSACQVSSTPASNSPHQRKLRGSPGKGARHRGGGNRAF